MKTPTGWTPSTTIAAALILAGFAACAALNWPGHLSYDSILQLHQGRLGLYNNWHPPVMAWLLGLSDALVPGAGLFVVLDCLLAFGALLALVLLKPERVTAATAVAVLGVVISPQILLYQGLVWKDVLFADAAVAGFVALAQAASSWPDRRIRTGWLSVCIVLLLLAALTRQNGMLLLPVAAAALGWIAAKGGLSGAKSVLFGAAYLAGLAVLYASATALLELRGDGNPGPAEQVRLLQLYDLSGAVAREPGLPLESLHDDDPKLEGLIRGEGVRLYTPVRNDPLAADPEISAALADADPEEIGTQWRVLIMEHSWLYLRVRAAAFFQVFATPDIVACRPIFTGIEGPEREMNDLGLAARRDGRDRALEGYGKIFLGTPAFSHVAFALLALGCLVLLLRRRTAPDIAMAGLVAGAFVFTASFFVISIACDYRYLYLLDLSALAALVYLAPDARSILRRTP